MEPSLRHTYCCLRREPQPLCSRLKEIALPDCVALYILTGIATSPNEMVSDPIDRAAMVVSGLTVPLWSGRPQDSCQILLGRKPIMPPVACLFQAGDHASQGEVPGLRPFELVPGEWHGDRAPGAPAGGIGGGEGLAAHVHVVIDENLTCA